MTLVLKSAVLASIVALAAGVALAGVPETPSLKPGKNLLPPPGAPVLSVNVATPAPATTPAPVLVQKSAAALYLGKALSAAERSQWSELSRLQYEAPDPALKNLIMWKRAADGVPGMTFDEIDLALTMLSDWPETDRMRRRAEEIIELSALDARARVAWLEKSGPQTGAGKVALANALRDLGERARSDSVIKDAWRNNTLESDVQRLVLARYGQTLSQDDHRARVDFLLWTGQTSAAEALKMLAGRVKRRGMVLLISDLLDAAEATVDALGRLAAAGHEVIALQVLDAVELDLPFSGRVRFAGLEGGGSHTCLPRQLRHDYREAARRFVATIAGDCRKHGADHHLLTTRTSVGQGLQAWLGAREHLAAGGGARGRR